MSAPGIPTPGQSGDPFTPGEFPEPWTDFDVFGHVVRIPVAGPVPFNTLATFNVLNGGLQVTGSEIQRATVVCPTPLTINRFDPDQLEHRQMRYSCTATLRRVSMVNDADFVVAVDEIGRRDPAGATPLVINGAGFDRHGNWSVLMSIGTAAGETMWWWAVVSCWVLFHEAEPPPPATHDEHRVRAQAIFAAGQLEAYRHYVTLPGANLWQASQELIVLDRQISAGNYPERALDAQRLTVTALRSYTPDAQHRLDYGITFAEQRHNLIARLVDNDASDQAAALLLETVAGYRDYLGLPDADVSRVGHDLADLARLMANARHPAEALDAQRACVDVLRSYTPTADTRLEYVIFFAEQRHNLIARLIDTDHNDEAAALLPETLDGYRDYLGMLGADRWRAGHDLAELAGWMDRAMRPREALDAQRVSVDALRSYVPAADLHREYLIYFAEQDDNLIVRLIGADHDDEAAGLVPETVSGYREYFGLAGADPDRARRDLRALADRLEGAGLTNGAALVRQALSDAHLS